MESGTETYSIPSAHTDFVKCLTVCRPDQPDILRDKESTPMVTVFSGSADSTARAWDITTGRCLRKYEGHRRGVEDLVLSLDGKRLFSASSDGTIRVFDVESGETLQVLEGHRTSVYALSLSFDGDDQELWSASADNTVSRWNLKTGKMDMALKHPDWVKCFLGVGPYLLTGSRDELVRVWDLSTEKCVHKYEGHFDEVSSLFAFGKMVYSGSYDCTVRRWDLSEGRFNFYIYPPIINFLCSSNQKGRTRAQDSGTGALEKEQDGVECGRRS